MEKASGGKPAPSGHLNSIMQESRVFPPPNEFVERAKINSLAAYEKLWREAADDVEKFWGALAGELFRAALALMSQDLADLDPGASLEPQFISGLVIEA